MKKDIRLTPELTDIFFESQLETWPLADDNYSTLEEAYDNKEDLLFGQRFWSVTKIIVNYRKASATADVGAATAGKRPCFLCEDALPPEQMILPWENYRVLVNPYPIGIPHFTIVNNEHTPQRINGHIREMAKMTRLFNECCVFYNGPLCGASAPDHLHFQAFDVYNMENIIRAFDFGDEILRIGESSVIAPAPNMYAVPFLIISLAKDADLEPLFERILTALPPADPEPMMNIVAARLSSRTLFAIFPRRSHRPQCYGPGTDQLLVSPATAEMLGLFPCVSEKEFRALDEPTIQKIYDDVCVTPETFSEIIEKIRS